MYTGILEALIMLMMKSHKCLPAHEQLMFIRLKQDIYDEFDKLREFDKSAVCLVIILLI